MRQLLVIAFDIMLRKYIRDCEGELVGATVQVQYDTAAVVVGPYCRMERSITFLRSHYHKIKRVNHWISVGRRKGCLILKFEVGTGHQG